MRSAISVSSIIFSVFLVSSSMAATDSSPAPADETLAIQGSVKPADAGAFPEALDPNVFHCGPIQAKDPMVREQIESLYKEQWDLQQSTLARLRDLSEAASDVADAEERQALAKEGIALKQTLRLRHVELGLEIAKLNDDASRVAEFEKALDQLRHPEKYMPAHTPDPELQARRARELGITK
jgi:hypothetical protein